MKIENDQYKGIGPVFDICSNKHGGNPMSVQANKIASKGKLGWQQRILSYFLSMPDCGLTCEQIEADLKERLTAHAPPMPNAQKRSCEPSDSGKTTLQI